MKESTSIIVTATDTAMKHMNEFVQKLTEKGMHIARIMPRTGVVSGEISNIQALEGMEGVLRVDREYTHHLQPPHSRIQ